MKKNKTINELEFDLLNGRQKPEKQWQLYLYNIIKWILYIIYIATCIVCSIIELLIWILSLGNVAMDIHKTNKKRR